MAGLAQFLTMLAPGAAVQAPAAYDPQLTPEANAMAGAAKPAAPKPPGFQRPKGLRNTVGIIADVLAAMGGKEMGYSSTLRSMEGQFNADRKTQSLSQFLMNPTDPEATNAFIEADPNGYMGYIKEMTPKAQNPGSRSPFQVAYDDAIEAGASRQEAQQAGIRVAQAIGERDGRLYPTSRGLLPEDQAVGAMPYRAPEAPQQPRTDIRSSGDGNDYLIDLNTGNKIKNLGPSAPKGTGGQPKQGGKPGQLADIDGMIASLKEAETSISKGGVSGPITGLVPNKALAFTNPRAVDTQERVASVTARNLKEILGGQFARAEGEALISRAYNPSLPEPVNLGRVQALRRAMEARRAEIAGGGSGGGTRQAPATGGVTVSIKGAGSYTFPNQKAADEFKRKAGL